MKDSTGQQEVPGPTGTHLEAVWQQAGQETVHLADEASEQHHVQRYALPYARPLHLHGNLLPRGSQHAPVHLRTTWVFWPAACMLPTVSLVLNF